MRLGWYPTRLDLEVQRRGGMSGLEADHMAKTFDATLKGMLEQSPGDWPVLAGWPRAETDVIDADVSTFSGAADKVLRVRASPDWIMHMEFQAGPDISLPQRLQIGNVLLDDRHGLLVRSVAVLLSPKANLSNLTGLHERRFPGQQAHLSFRYQIIRVWQLPVEPLLTGGLGLLPLAPISATSEGDLPGVVERMKQRLSRPEVRAQASGVWTATYVLLGLRYPTNVAQQLLREVMAMEESTTYQAIIGKGREMGKLEELRRTILLQGVEKFGRAPRPVATAIESVGDIERLEQLAVRLMHATGWDELLDRAAAGPRARRRKPKA